MTEKHERQLIREAVVAQLKGPGNNRTAAGARVNKSRMEPARSAHLPLISVYSADEITKEASAKSSPRVLERTPRIVIVGWVVANEEVDDAADALALEIETAMDIDPNFDGYAFDSVYESTQVTIDVTGERPMAAVALTYAITYETHRRIAAPTDVFDKAGVQTSIDGTQATADQRADLVTGIHAE